jgi:8-hydroxy-5-deazaflavin:NADPH oxidoreductase
MKIAVLGTGLVGQSLAKKLTELNHNVFLGTRNVENTLAKNEPDNWGNPPVGVWLKNNAEISLVTFNHAVEKGTDLIVFAMNGDKAFDCLESIDEKLLKGKIMIDISNPLDFSKGFPPTLSVSNTDSLAEQIQAKFPLLKVVKTLNTMSNPLMVNPSLLEGDHTVFMSGNDNDSKEKVKQILENFGWKQSNIMDLGDITTARGTEMFLPLWLRVFGKIQTPFFNINIKHSKK